MELSARVASAMSILSGLVGLASRLLISGFERILARTISRGVSADVLTGIILAREKRLGTEAARAIAEFVVAGQRAAEAIERLPSDVRLPDADIPVNPYLFFNEIAADRYYVQGAVEVLDPQGDVIGTRPVTLRGYDLPTSGDIFAALESMAKDMMAGTDEQAIQLGTEKLRARVVRLEIVQRKF